MQIIVVDKRLARALTLSVTRRHALAASITLAARCAAVIRRIFVFDGARCVRRSVSLFFRIWFRSSRAMRWSARTSSSAITCRRWRASWVKCRRSCCGSMRSVSEWARPPASGPKSFALRSCLAVAARFESDPMTLRELDVALKQLSASVEQRADYMSVIEAELRAQQVRQALLPHSKPLSDGFVGSGFGWRSDPFSGEMSHHSGIDFAAPTGTPIHAAAGGVVVLAEYHPVWGNIVEVDHGNSLLSRYAHASRLNVARAISSSAARSWQK